MLSENFENSKFKQTSFPRIDQDFSIDLARFDVVASDGKFVISVATVGIVIAMNGMSVELNMSIHQKNCKDSS
ncbi:hypothetical protein BpHYR1_044350 [Brachionus plicatilis]|uniref:Uncharacterized protein n=1 Tax=Brachionus plicatilis TaxID=10195 RepID=A0A3M7QPL5_BRAPC|nr:hypothetical protein BpHYR1_044350 [Brachionus plicatilis]